VRLQCRLRCCCCCRCCCSHLCLVGERLLLGSHSSCKNKQGQGTEHSGWQASPVPTLLRKCSLMLLSTASHRKTMHAWGACQ
jgi:hypothetical protein